MEISQDSPGKKIKVTAVSHPLAQQSFMVRSAALVSGGIIYGADLISAGLEKGSDYAIKNMKPVETGVQFSPTTKQNIKRIHGMSQTAAKYSSRTTGAISSVAHGIGSAVRGKKEKKDRSKPGFKNRSLAAFDLIMESVDQSTKQGITFFATMHL